MVDFFRIHVLAQRDPDLAHPWQRADLALHIGGHQEGEVGGAPIGRQTEADRYGTVLVHRQMLDEPQIGHGFIEFRIGHAVERETNLRLAFGLV